MKEESLLTKKEAAKRLNISHRTVEAWMAQRRIAYIKLGRSVRFKEKDIKAVEEAGYRRRLNGFR